MTTNRGDPIPVWLLLIGSALKIGYDLILLTTFRNIRPLEERARLRPFRHRLLKANRTGPWLETKGDRPPAS